jgi:hypothetical protein
MGGEAAIESWPAQRRECWGDFAWWQRQIDYAVGTVDPVLCNRRITLAHQELSLALHEITGPDSGANFHTWAVWGSNKAGSTIRREDMPWLGRAAAAAGALLGGSAASLARGVGRPAVRAAAGATCSGAVLSEVADQLLGRAARSILAGNITVIDDIGRQTARFVSLFRDPAARSRDRLEELGAGLRTGSPQAGGQDLLRAAYHCYFEAIGEPDPDRRDEAMLLANLSAILHEHWRLEPYIRESLPAPFRRIVTRDLLNVRIGSATLRVGQDVPVAGSAYPDTLRKINDPDLERFLNGPEGWDRTPDTLAGSGAGDWTEIRDRMSFICDLFRAHQLDPALFTPPFDPSERDRLLAGEAELEREGVYGPAIARWQERGGARGPVDLARR